MDFSGKENEVEECLPPGVFEIPGEPAVAINGLPPISPNVDDTFLPCPVVTDTESYKNVVFGQLFEGRQVHKLSGDNYYNGKVIRFDEETGWFRVKYEDGNNEDLEWHELEEVLQPLDINIPLEKVIKKFMKKKH
ncbi:dirigent protein 17-like [Solanum pennellii]|uniref:Dirigent protein 17-like n=1 Tax=Solanum pennellii TaxID=28526 RepID=A0ABM1HM70_SOLPN|nr:dirigent protein 17-like [Solanum pennellii]